MFFRLGDNSSLDISSICQESYPCQHRCVLNGKSTSMTGVEICNLLIYNGIDVPEHYQDYIGWEQKQKAKQKEELEAKDNWDEYILPNQNVLRVGKTCWYINGKCMRKCIDVFTGRHFMLDEPAIENLVKGIQPGKLNQHIGLTTDKSVIEPINRHMSEYQINGHVPEPSGFKKISSIEGFNGTMIILVLLLIGGAIYYYKTFISHAKYVH
jgi:hypothetical protein